MKPTTRDLVSDMVRAGAPAALVRDAAAGDFDPGRGDPTELARRWPHIVAEAAAVRAYVAPMARPPLVPARPGRSYLLRPLTPVQAEALAAVRRMVDDGVEVTQTKIAQATAYRRNLTDDVISALVDRGMLEAMPPALPVTVTTYVLGPRAHLHPERSVRTQRSHAIEALIRRGLSPDDIIADPSIDPHATRAEVYRVRGAYCRDLPTTGEVGPTHRDVVARVRAGETNQSQIARELGRSSGRVRGIIEHAKRRQEIP